MILSRESLTMAPASQKDAAERAGAVRFRLDDVTWHARIARYASPAAPDPRPPVSIEQAHHVVEPTATSPSNERAA